MKAPILRAAGRVKESYLVLTGGHTTDSVEIVLLSYKINQPEESIEDTSDELIRDIN